MENIEYIKCCSKCGASFKTDKKKQRVCNNCKKANKLRLAREVYDDFKKPRVERKEKTGNSINDFVILVEEYNAKNKTHYTYGEFEAALRLGKIKRTELFH